MMFIRRISPWGDRERSHRLQVLRRGLAVLARDQLVSHLLAFVQGGKARLLVGMTLVASPGPAQDSAPQIPFDATHPLKRQKDLYVGEVTGVAVNPQGRVFVLSRGNTTGAAYAAAAAQPLDFDPEGKFVR